MKKTLMAFLAIFLLAGCAQKRDFSFGLAHISQLNSKYNTSMSTYPNNTEQIKLMLSEFSELKGLRLDTGQEPFGYLVKYRMLNLEAEELLIKGNKYGDFGTTKFGFGCKQSPIVIESAQLRNRSAMVGFEAVSLLREFISKYPEEAKSAGLSEKDALFLNATFYLAYSEAKKDSSTISRLCQKSRVLELYQEEFRKKTDYSEDYINNLNYETATAIWKKLRGFE
ncbi:hypothetical protein HY637_00320 [Candidatus Woesearchaeota archaeon]|nr:hypothetical protein [Candidatus Woesearchaeota archaeon]